MSQNQESCTQPAEPSRGPQSLLLLKDEQELLREVQAARQGGATRAKTRGQEEPRASVKIIRWYNPGG